eukprot:m.65631 g.65631  ORF g.65631 m.65631 type:complete len:339 (-) comp9775_c0_seq1:282-1298(-)
MIEGYDPVTQALLGTLFTWGVTAAGSAVVFLANTNRKLLDCSLGFSAGVMLAASYWSLLAPAIEMASESGDYGAEGEWAFVPAAIGFALGAFFVYYADVLLGQWGFGDGVVGALTAQPAATTAATVTNDGESDAKPFTPRREGLRPRKGDKAAATPTTTTAAATTTAATAAPAAAKNEGEAVTALSWRRTMLLAAAVTIHNIPEGLAVGVGFGAVGTVKSATFASARNLAIGIGIQNFPEGLAVSLPLHRAGFSKTKAFWYGQLSGMVEPVAGLLGALAVSIATPVLPYALAFAAGAMVFVVLDSIVPDYQDAGNAKLATWGAVLGFIVMMSLDVGLG